jgi:hypothetical protein
MSWLWHRVDCQKFIVPSFPTMKLEVVGSSIFIVETEPVASSKTSVSFHHTSYPERWNSWRTEELCNRCSAACTLFTFNGWMGQCYHIKCTSISSKVEIARSWNLNCVVLSFKRNLAFQRPYTKTEVHQAVLQHWQWLTPVVIRALYPTLNFVPCS